MSSRAEQVKQIMPNSPIHRLMGIELESVDDEQALCKQAIKPDFFHAGGFLHGGIAYTLADTAVAMLLLYRVEFKREVFTIEGKLNYLASVPTGSEGSIFARATLKHQGKSTAVCDVDVHNDSERLLAHGIFTYALR